MLRRTMVAAVIGTGALLISVTQNAAADPAPPAPSVPAGAEAATAAPATVIDVRLPATTGAELTIGTNTGTGTENGTESSVGNGFENGPGNALGNGPEMAVPLCLTCGFAQ